MLKYNKKSEELMKLFLKRLRGTEGNIDLAATSIGISPNTIRSWRKRDKQFCELMDNVKEQVQRELST